MDELRAGTAVVWWIRSDLRPRWVARLARCLDDTERRRADALVHDTDRRRFIVAHGAARRILAGYLGSTPRQLRWNVGPNGKPLVDGLRMNLSHSANLVALAVTANRDVGVDIQWCAPGIPAARMAERFYPEAEARFVAAGHSQVDTVNRFVQLWARKEAVVKAAGGRITPGLGLSVGGPGERVVSGPSLAGPFRVSDLAAPDGFHAALALRGPDHFEITTRWYEGDGGDDGSRPDRPHPHREPPLSSGPGQ